MLAGRSFTVRLGTIDLSWNPCTFFLTGAGFEADRRAGAFRAAFAAAFGRDAFPRDFFTSLTLFTVFLFAILFLPQSDQST
jgi:hypothetical protein